MEWNLKRIKTMWDHVEVTPPKKPEFRVNRYSNTMVHHEIEFADVTAVPNLFSELQSLLQGRCLDLQFIFDGAYPVSELKALGFAPSQGESRIWNKSHPEYRISAIRIESTNSWILEVMKRSGRGVLSDAARLDFLTGSGEYEVQLTIPLNVEVIAS